MIFSRALKAIAFSLTPRFIKAFADFRRECNDDDKKHYEVAIRLDGLNIEYLPSREPGEKEGRNITVPWSKK